MFELNPNQMLIIPALIALNEGLKKYFNVDTKYCVATNWLVGPIFNFIFVSATTPEKILSTILIGFLLGSAAGGIYDIKNLIIGGKDNATNK